MWWTAKHTPEFRHVEHRPPCEQFVAQIPTPIAFWTPPPASRVDAAAAAFNIYKNIKKTTDAFSADIAWTGQASTVLYKSTCSLCFSVIFVVMNDFYLVLWSGIPKNHSKSPSALVPWLSIMRKGKSVFDQISLLREMKSLDFCDSDQIKLKTGSVLMESGINAEHGSWEVGQDRN